MKLALATLFALSALLTATVAQAQLSSAPTAAPTPAPDTVNDPRFTFSTAASAFNAAKLATPAEIGGTWLNLGVANDPDLRARGSYAADGRIVDGPMVFKDVSTFKYSQNAFGTVVLIQQDRRLMDGERPTYESAEHLVSMTPSSYTYTTEHTSSVCSVEVQCRRTSNALLICSAKSVDNSGYCSRTDAIVSYRVFRKVDRAFAPQPTSEPKGRP